MRRLLGALFLILSFTFVASASSDAIAAPPKYQYGIEGKPRGTDNYTFEGKQFTKLEFPVKVVEYKSSRELVEEFIKRKGKTYETPPPIVAFSSYVDGVCEIHIFDPAIIYEPHFYGHELMHCVHGAFHPRQGP